MQYVKHWRMRELLGIFGNLCDRIFRHVQKTADRMETEGEIKRKFFRGQKKVCISGLTALTRLTTA